MTEPRTALGRWPNAPLALVLAQVRFTPTPDVAPDLVVERIRQTAGSSFPICRKLQNVTLNFGQVGNPDAQIPQPPQTIDLGHDLRTSGNDEALLINPGAFTFMTAAYVDSTDFRNRWKSFMDTVFNGNELQVTRLGLRYVDFIIPSEGHSPEDYFLGLDRSPGGLGGQAPFASMSFNYPRDDGGNLRVQYFRGLMDPALPADLQGGVTLPVHRPRRNTDGPSGVLDMDRWRTGDTPMSAAAAADALLELRQDIAKSFRSIMTGLAKEEWMGLTTKR